MGGLRGRSVWSAIAVGLAAGVLGAALFMVKNWKRMGAAFAAERSRRQGKQNLN